MEPIHFAVLGLGVGALYALVAHGVVLIYRGSGTLNFAQGAFGLVGTYAFYDLHVDHGWPSIAPLISSIFQWPPSRTKS